MPSQWKQVYGRKEMQQRSALSYMESIPSVFEYSRRELQEFDVVLALWVVVGIGVEEERERREFSRFSLKLSGGHWTIHGWRPSEFMNAVVSFTPCGEYCTVHVGTVCSLLTMLLVLGRTAMPFLCDPTQPCCSTQVRQLPLYSP